MSLIPLEKNLRQRPDRAESFDYEQAAQARASPISRENHPAQPHKRL
jgi:hypothetical protein